ncbi:MAG: nucleotidyltransferase family protein [Akkermansiaceae bacterium]|nr:nucleotidyltransferase family protein [Armatimonadota bacterium]
MITAGGRLSPELAAVCGTTVKALVPLGDSRFIDRVVFALRDSGAVSAIAIVGPVSELQAAGIAADVWADEKMTGPENIQQGIVALREAGYLIGEERLLLCATDAIFLGAGTVIDLLAVAQTQPEADIVFPIVRREVYEQQFPGSPNVYAPLADGAFTGSSVQVVRPSAIERCLPYIEKAFAARKSQWEMAKLLGWNFTWRFITRTLTVDAAVAKVSAVTGLNCHAPIFPSARIAADVDTLADYEYAMKLTRDS